MTISMDQAILHPHPSSSHIAVLVHRAGLDDGHQGPGLVMMTHTGAAAAADDDDEPRDRSLTPPITKHPRYHHPSSDKQLQQAWVMPSSSPSEILHLTTSWMTGRGRFLSGLRRATTCDSHHRHHGGFFHPRCCEVLLTSSRRPGWPVDDDRWKSWMVKGYVHIDWHSYTGHDHTTPVPLKPNLRRIDWVYVTGIDGSECDGRLTQPVSDRKPTDHHSQALISLGPRRRPPPSSSLRSASRRRGPGRPGRERRRGGELDR